MLPSTAQAVAPHATLAPMQLPSPSQWRKVPEPTSQGVIGGANAMLQSFAVLHCPSVEHRFVLMLAAGAEPHSGSTSQATRGQALSSAGNTSHLPVPARQAMQGPLQELSQHTPSTHCPLKHSVAVEQVVPRDFFETEQFPEPSHNAVLLQDCPLFLAVLVQTSAGLPQLPEMQRLVLTALGKSRQVVSPGHVTVPQAASSLRNWQPVPEAVQSLQAVSQAAVQQTRAPVAVWRQAPSPHSEVAVQASPALRRQPPRATSQPRVPHSR